MVLRVSWTTRLLAAAGLLSALPSSGSEFTRFEVLIGAGCQSGGDFQIETSEWVSLPFADEDTPVASGSLTIEETGGAPSSGPVRVLVTGPFSVTGDLGPLAAHEVRTLTVTYLGPVAEPLIAIGEAEIAVDSEAASLPLYAVVGDKALPPATYLQDRYGRTTQIPLPSAPYPAAGSPKSDVLISIPTGWTDQGDLGIVTHIHGWYATLSTTVPAQDLVEQHSNSGRDGILVVPQGPYNQPSGDFGQLMDPDGFSNLVRDAVSVLYRDAILQRPALGDITVTSHSGGYQCVSSILQHGGLPVDAVHLFDSLYGEEEVFEDFALAGGTLRSNYTASGGTDDNNILFRSNLENMGLEVGTSFDDDDLLAYTVTVGYSASSHDHCISDERSYARWLTWSGARRTRSAPPELRSVLSDGLSATVRWIPDGDRSAVQYRVEGSSDGLNWERLAETSAHEVSIPARPWVRVVVVDEAAVVSDPSDRYSGSGREWLVVDGFDRVTGGSWFEVTHGFPAVLGNALGAGVSTVSNEAVQKNEVDLADYPRILWMLGDESGADLTLDTREQEALERAMDLGCRVLLTGAEVGYATSASWLQTVLHATYVADDALSNQAGGYTFGVAYPEDYPDVLSGSVSLWNYSTGGAAAVGWEHQSVVVGFPLETLAESDLQPALAELTSWLEATP